MSKYRAETSVVVIILVGLLCLVVGAAGAYFGKGYLDNKTIAKKDAEITQLKSALSSQSKETASATSQTASTATAATSASKTPSEPAVIPGKYPETATREIAEADLISKTDWELDIMRNEIYARYGRTFVRADLQNYFDQQSWYAANADFSESDLTQLETKNATFIRDWQENH